MTSKDIKKRFNAAAASYILGESPSVEVMGTPEKISVVREVLQASRNLYEELQLPDTHLTRVITLLEKKRAAAREFYERVGTTWIL
jgi:hypothetical protein